MQPVPPAPSPIVLGSCDATEEVIIFVDAAGRASSFLRHLIAPVSLSQQRSPSPSYP